MATLYDDYDSSATSNISRQASRECTATSNGYCNCYGERRENTFTSKLGRGHVDSAPVHSDVDRIFYELMTDKAKFSLITSFPYTLADGVIL
ncbi:6748_t:CDS:2 [Ambispora gerdemannii]|uniref:6748_t:CDS:1 n=1 Tax=Ambispora gerdemannii TaxID=144530 RepID=A0A9N9C0F7_9GLOM|nr:6748_t:CDS:2 [Ambispora gerdemannii]